MSALDSSFDTIRVLPEDRYDRQRLIPWWEQERLGAARVLVIGAGALGGGISGSGPSIFMLSQDESTASAGDQIMQDVYRNISLHHYTYVTTVNQQGCSIIEQD